ncbi:hypothetical protein F5884DRAFT_674112 [Xylogone sp. PMI_703]|nr:hypothetical protein F5884DRAFT_674112 [Xylogone sp. PMI_703]
MASLQNTKNSIKHKACDECRSRKLACSKEPDGCERCRKEGIACHYSEQKPMGRPRKKRPTETSKDIILPDDKVQESGHTLQPIATDIQDSYHDISIPDPYFTDIPIDSNEITADQNTPRDLSPIWTYRPRGEMEGPDSFGDFDFLLELGNSSSSDQNIQVMNSEVQSTVHDATNSQKTSTAGPCGCLATMYLSLASLQEFPSDIKTALFTVRSAAVTAERALYCPQCGMVLITELDPPMAAFQNMMLLGTILPIIADGYVRLLKMIDEETDVAIAADQTKTFCLQEYGGICGKLNAVEHDSTCKESALFFNRVELQPSQWRNAVRALLRMDIYGYDQQGFKRKGLRDLVSELQLRQETRHNRIDATVAAGFVDAKHYCGQSASEPRTCLQIIQIAKRAIDNLVIP